MIFGLEFRVYPPSVAELLRRTGAVRLKAELQTLAAQDAPPGGSALNSGARLYEPQHIPMQSKPLRVADPRSENKSGHYRKSACLVSPAN